MKNKLKTESKYSVDLMMNGDYESVEILQEENVDKRNAIKIKMFEDRWRSPKETVDFLKKIITLLEDNFI